MYGTTKNITVVNDAVRYVVGTNSRQSIKQYLIDMLKKHPEGIVYYDYDIPHAILLTDYAAEEDMFYCSDPNKGTPTKRVPVTNSSVNLYNYYRSSVWYIKSPELYLTSNSTATSGKQTGKRVSVIFKLNDNDNISIKVASSSWFKADDFQLIYYGRNSNKTTSLGIEDVQTDPTFVNGIYTANGIKVAELQKGVNIVRTNKGVKKIMKLKE